MKLDMILQLNLYITRQIPYLHLKIVYPLFYSINLELKTWWTWAKFSEYLIYIVIIIVKVVTLAMLGFSIVNRGEWLCNPT